jgi:hypothetical protein
MFRFLRSTKFLFLVAESLLLLTSHEEKSAALIIYNTLQSTLKHEQA